MPKTPMDYGKTIMYKIVCNDLTIKDCYVGHTINMVKRKCAHKYACNNEKNKAHNLKIYKIIRQNGGWDNWNMVLVEKFPCKDSSEACKREREVYEELDAKMNMIRPYFTQEEHKKYGKEYREDHKEYYKQYREEHKEYYKQNYKKYWEEHKEELKKYHKQYYQERKEQKNEKIECEFCAKLISKQNMPAHHKICKSKE